MLTIKSGFIGAIGGRKTNEGDESIIYELDEGLLAGGRFIVWMNNDNLKVEFTIYGSGLPILKSERGHLVIEQ